MLKKLLFVLLALAMLLTGPLLIIAGVIVGTKKPANVAKNVELLSRDLPEGLLEKAKAAVSE